MSTYDAIAKARSALDAASRELEALGAAPLRGDVFIFINETTFNVSEHYRRKGFSLMPPTLTMAGYELKYADKIDSNYNLFCDDPFNEYWLDRVISDSDAVPLVNAMRFYSTPPVWGAGCGDGVARRRILDWSEIHSRYRRQDYSVTLWKDAAIGHG